MPRYILLSGNARTDDPGIAQSDRCADPARLYVLTGMLSACPLSFALSHLLYLYSVRGRALSSAQSGWAYFVLVAASALMLFAA